MKLLSSSCRVSGLTSWGISRAGKVSYFLLLTIHQYALGYISCADLLHVWDATGILQKHCLWSCPDAKVVWTGIFRFLLFCYVRIFDHDMGSSFVMRDNLLGFAAI